MKGDDNEDHTKPFVPDHGGDAFWRAFTLRTCRYLDRQFLTKIEDQEKYIKAKSHSIMGTKCSGCSFSLSYNDERHVKCINCNAVVHCGKHWCSTVEKLRVKCGICERACCKDCINTCDECDNTMCRECRIKCFACEAVTCRDHTYSCDEYGCDEILYCDCNEYVERHNQRFHTKRIKTEEENV